MHKYNSVQLLFLLLQKSHVLHCNPAVEHDSLQKDVQIALRSASVAHGKKKNPTLLLIDPSHDFHTVMELVVML